MIANKTEGLISAELPPTDPSVLRRRRMIELCALVTRGLAVLGTLLYLPGWAFSAADVLPASLLPVCEVGVAVMTAACLLSWVSFRRPASRWYGWLSGCQVAMDLTVIVTIVSILTIHGDKVAWPTLVVSIVVAALRHRLPGALAAWFVTSAAFSAAILAAAPHFQPANLVLPWGLHLLVALVVGTQSSALARQITDLQDTRQALHHQVTHDALTGLPNRALLTAFAQRHSADALAVMVIDLDGFKQVNDTLGHAAGDHLLYEVGQRISGALRHGDMAGRTGGDEFLVLLPGADTAATEGVAARIRAAVGSAMQIGDAHTSVGASIGYALRSAGSDRGLDALTRKADEHMYAAKRATRVLLPGSERDSAAASGAHR